MVPWESKTVLTIIFILTDDNERLPYDRLSFSLHLINLVPSKIKLLWHIMALSACCYCRYKLILKLIFGFSFDFCISSKPKKLCYNIGMFRLVTKDL